MISYKPFQKMLIDKNIKKQDLIKETGISSGTMAKLNTNKYVSLEVIERLCVVLKCYPWDLFEYIPGE